MFNHRIILGVPPLAFPHLIESELFLPFGVLTSTLTAMRADDFRVSSKEKVFTALSTTVFKGLEKT